MILRLAMIETYLAASGATAGIDAFSKQYRGQVYPQARCRVVRLGPWCDY
jgi:hypothetical protein